MKQKNGVAFLGSGDNPVRTTSIAGLVHHHTPLGSEDNPVRMTSIAGLVHYHTLLGLEDNPVRMTSIAGLVTGVAKLLEKSIGIHAVLDTLIG